MRPPARRTLPLAWSGWAERHRKPGSRCRRQASDISNQMSDVKTQMSASNGQTTIPIRHFTDLIVWQKAHALSREVFQLSKTWLPLEVRICCAAI